MRARYLRTYTRQRMELVFAGVCIVLFFASRGTFLPELQRQPLILSVDKLKSSLPSSSSPSAIVSSSPRSDLSIPPLAVSAPKPPTSTPISAISALSTSTSSLTVSSSALTPKPTPLYPKSRTSLSPACDGYPDVSDVAIVVKTGGTEAYNKIPVLVLTFLQCQKDDVLIFADMEMDIGNIHIYDALDMVTEKTRNHSDFDLYNTQKQYQLGDGEVSNLDRGSDAWRLDKYKNIHTAQKAYELMPNKSWYFFIDADTYVVWSSFFGMLKRMDPNEKLYLGSEVSVGRPPFAHGGSGYVLSKAAMAELVGSDAKELAARFEENAATRCCGDQELARALFYKGIRVKNVRPLMNGERWRTIHADWFQWCQPLVTMHHMPPEAINNIWKYEEERGHRAEPLLTEDFYHEYVKPKIASQRDEWDNASNDEVYTTLGSEVSGSCTSDQPYSSFENCNQTCIKEPECLQFSYHDGECAISKSIKVGEHRPTRNGVVYKSVWLMDRISKLAAGKGPCKSPAWEEYD